jgi:hypothetical protein
MKTGASPATTPVIIGWREWLNLPALGISGVKAKIDTGARTSALHAFYTEFFLRDDQDWVRFGVHPDQGDNSREIHCESPVLERRVVTDSGGHKEERPVIVTDIDFNGYKRQIEITLTDRDTMRFKMLLGRTAIRRGFLVSPGQSFMLGGTKDHPGESN